MAIQAPLVHYNSCDRLSLPRPGGRSRRIRHPQFSFPQGIAGSHQCGYNAPRLASDHETTLTYESRQGGAKVPYAVEGYLVVAANYQRRPALIELDFDGLFLREIRLSGLPEDAVDGLAGVADDPLFGFL